MIRFEERHRFDDLEKWFHKLVENYYKWAEFSFLWKIKRKETIKQLEFPFSYREGQRDLAVAVFRTIERKKNIFIQAPTGVGKTMSTIFPAIKAVGEDLGDKIFYLTAKTITRSVAEEGFRILRKNGLAFSNITVTAKDKICFREQVECNPIYCDYAKGHYDRVNDAVYDIVTQEQDISRDMIIKYANKHEVCPFEYSLDISLWVDGIICDYNYVFNPNVQLKRYFGDGVKGNYLFLVDEAHNLVERGRDMFSAAIYKEKFLEHKKLLQGKSIKIERLLDKCNKDMLTYKRRCDGYTLLTNIGDFVIKLMNLISEFELFMEENKDYDDLKNLLEFYFEIRMFLFVFERLDDNYISYCEILEDGRFMMKLFCVNPSKNLCETLNKGNSTVFFSATLLPVQYYIELLSGDVSDYTFYINSPFPKENRIILITNDISSKYTRRNVTEYRKYSNYIKIH